MNFVYLKYHVSFTSYLSFNISNEFIDLKIHEIVMSITLICKETFLIISFSSENVKKLYLTDYYILLFVIADIFEDFFMILGTQ